MNLIPSHEMGTNVANYGGYPAPVNRGILMRTSIMQMLKLNWKQLISCVE